MPSTSVRPPGPEADPGLRPLAASFATAFGALLTTEVLIFGVLMVVADPRLDRATLVAATLVLAAAVGSLMVFQGRRGGWLVLVLASVGAFAGLFLLLLVIRALGVPAEPWAVALLAAPPLGCLVLAPQRAVRSWAGPAPAGRPAGAGAAAAGRR